MYVYQQKSSDYRILITTGATDSVVEVASIRLNRKNNELFYIFHFNDKRGLIRFIDYSKPTPTETVEQYPDHISFHKDGVVHLYGKDKRNSPVKRNLIQLPRSPFLLGQDKYKPLLYHSVNLVNNTCLPHHQEKNIHQRELNIASKTGSLTIVVFSVGCNVITENMMVKHFPYAFEKYVEIGNIFTVSDKPNTSRLVMGLASNFLPKTGPSYLFSFGLAPPEVLFKNLSMKFIYQTSPDS